MPTCVVSWRWCNFVPHSFVKGTLVANAFLQVSTCTKKLYLRFAAGRRFWFLSDCVVLFHSLTIAPKHYIGWSCFGTLEHKAFGLFRFVLFCFCFCWVSRHPCFYITRKQKCSSMGCFEPWSLRDRFDQSPSQCPKSESRAVETMFSGSSGYGMNCWTTLWDAKNHRGLGIAVWMQMRFKLRAMRFQLLSATIWVASVWKLPFSCPNPQYDIVEVTIDQTIIGIPRVVNGLTTIGTVWESVRPTVLVVQDVEW